MLRVEFIETKEETYSNEPIDLTAVDPSELVTDADEIRGIFRRAMMVRWKDCAFTYDEMAEHLTRNYVVIPESVKERNDWFDQLAADIERQQADLAHAALRLPRIFHEINPNDNTLYHGIADSRSISVPANPEPVIAEPATIAQPEIQADAEVIDLVEKLPPLSRAEIANRIIAMMTETKVFETVLEVTKIKSGVLMERPSTDEKDIDEVMKELLENGYVELRNTRKKQKFPRWNLVMDQQTKQDIITDMEDGGFDAMLAHMFGGSSTASVEGQVVTL